MVIHKGFSVIVFDYATRRVCLERNNASFPNCKENQVIWDSTKTKKNFKKLEYEIGGQVAIQAGTFCKPESVIHLSGIFLLRFFNSQHDYFLSHPPLHEFFSVPPPLTPHSSLS